MRLERTIIAVTTRGVGGTCGTRDRCHVEQWGDVFNAGRDSDSGKKKRLKGASGEMPFNSAHTRRFCRAYAGSGDRAMFEK